MSTFLKYWATSIDRISFFSIIFIISIGIWISLASTPSVAIKLGLAPFHFVKNHIIAAPIATFIIVIMSCLQAKHIRLFAFIGYFFFLLLIFGALFFGVEIKGARRWLAICGASIQPSEFIKPIMTVITAWLVAEQYRDRKFPGIIFSTISMVAVVTPVLLQPDIGMSFILTTTWIGQLFISGLSILTIILFSAASVCSLIALYFTLPHFSERVNKFFEKDGAETDTYQVQKSIEAFKSGGFFGKGPGERIVKTIVPDAHSDFVFSVIGEEFGLALCMIIVILFVFVLVRAIIKAMNSSSIFIFSAIFGLSFQIAMQILINIATSLNLIPTKGMTLPFISYGGSSIISSAISMGILFALTKRNSLHREIL